MGASISWMDEHHEFESGNHEMPGGLDVTSGINFVRNADTVNISGGTFTMVGRDSITYYNITQTVHTDEQRLSTILDWISAINYRPLQQEIHDKRTPGTVMWFITSLLFMQWLESACGVLWGIGMPGAGKTILASAIIAYLQDRFGQDHNVCVAFAYCRYTEPVSVTEILAALVRQQVEQFPSLVQFVEPLYRRHSLEKTKLTQRELLDLLRHFAQVIRVVYIIDGLDEASYDTQFDLVEAISSLNARFLITSRPLDRLKSVVPDAVFFDVVANSDDIERLVAQKIQRDPRFSAFLERHRLKDEVVAKVRKNSRGMFLHASLQIEMLRHSVTVKGLRDQLQRLPAKVEDMYAATLSRVNSQAEGLATLAKRILIWVIYAERTLTIKELQYAVATCPDTHRFEEDRLVDEETLLSVCCGLVTLEKASQRVRLVHYTAMDSLPSLLDTEFPHPHALLAQVCLAQLVDSDFPAFTSTNADDLYKAFVRQPILKYAHSQWSSHVKQSWDHDSVKQKCLKFLSICVSFPLSSRALYTDFDDYDGVEHLNSLQTASYYGLHEPLVELLEINPEFKDVAYMNSQTETGQTALMLASWEGHDDVVRAFLDLQGVDFDLANKARATALRQALTGGHEDVVKTLVASGKIDINKDNCETLMSVLASFHAPDIAHHLLDMPDIKIPLAVLCYALERPWYQMSKRIIEKHFPAGGRREEHSTNLVTAALGSVVSMPSPTRSWPANGLIDEDGVAVRTTHVTDWDAYEPSYPENYEGIVTQLLELSDEDAPLATAAYGRTLLMVFSWAGLEKAVTRILPRPGVNINAVDKDGCTALTFAARQGHEAVVCRLVDVPGREINTRQYRGWTPLMMASWRGHVAVIRTLLAQPDIEVDAIGVEGWTAVMLAANGGYGEAMKTFCEYQGIVDVNIKGKDGETALMLAASEGYEEVVTYLLAFKDIDVNAVANDGTTSLMLASYMGHEGVVRLLLATPDIAVDAVGIHGITALSVAREAGHGGIVQCLRGHLEGKNSY